MVDQGDLSWLEWFEDAEQRSLSIITEPNRTGSTRHAIDEHIRGALDSQRSHLECLDCTPLDRSWLDPGPLTVQCNSCLKCKTISRYNKLESFHPESVEPNSQLLAHGKASVKGEHVSVQEHVRALYAADGKNPIYYTLLARFLGYTNNGYGSFSDSYVFSGFPHLGEVLWADRHPSLWPKARGLTDAQQALLDQYRSCAVSHEEMLFRAAPYHGWDEEKINKPRGALYADPTLDLDGWNIVSPMIDGTRLKQIPMDQPASAPYKSGFFSTIHFIRQRWCLETKKFLKTRVIGNDLTKNEILNPRGHGLQLRSHPALSYIIAYGLNPDWVYPTIQSKQDVSEDLGLELSQVKSTSQPSLTPDWRARLTAIHNARQASMRDASKSSKKRSRTHWSALPFRTRQRKDPTSKALALLTSKLDLKNAYFQLPVSSPWLNLFKVWNPILCVWIALISFIMSFGCRHSGYNWCSYIHLVELACCYMLMPGSIYIDDIIHFAPAAAPHFCLLYQTLITRLLVRLGIAITSKKDGCIIGRVGSPTSVLGLDYLTALDPDGEWYTEIVLDDSKCKDLCMRLDFLDARLQAVSGCPPTATPLTASPLQPSWLPHDVLPEDSAQQSKSDISLQSLIRNVAGVVGFCVFNSKYRSGIKELQRLWLASEFDDERLRARFRSDPRFYVSLRFAVQSLKDYTLSRPVCQRLDRKTLSKERATVYSDASLEGTKIGLGGLRHLPDGSVDSWGISLSMNELPEPLREKTITFYETLAAFVCVRLWKSDHVDWIFSIDNSAALFSIVKQNCKDLSTCSLVNLLLDDANKQNLFIWWVYINTKRNPADKLSRISSNFHDFPNQCLTRSQVLDLIFAPDVVGCVLSGRRWNEQVELAHAERVSAPVAPNRTKRSVQLLRNICWADLSTSRQQHIARPLKRICPSPHDRGGSAR